MLELRGKPVVEKLESELIKKIKLLKTDGIVPTLSILRVGEDSGQLSYEKSIVKKAENLGINVKKVIKNIASKTDDIIKEIEFLNNDKNVNGILLLQPLPKSMDASLIRNSISKDKDVDCISDKSLGDFFVNYGKQNVIAPCTPEAVLEILKFYGYKLLGKKVVILGRSMVVGKPLQNMLLEENMTVSICHSKTPKEVLVELCRSADYIVSCVGRYDFMTKDAFTKGQVLIDVGINFVDGKLVGDFNVEKISDIVEAMTPVPGGIGGITTLLLMKHIVDCTYQQKDCTYE